MGAGIRVLAVATEATLVGSLIERELSGLPILFGRTDEADVTLNDPSVARSQARLTRSDSGYRIEDLGSGSTRLNERRLPVGQAVPVRPGERIGMGVFQVVFFEAHERAAALEPRALARDLARRFTEAVAAVRVRIENGPQAGKSAWLGEGGAITIGRGEGCDLRLDDRRVSRRHACLSFAQGRIWLEDAGSTNGVRVAGRVVVERTELAPGDRIGVGPFRLRLIAELGQEASWGALLQPPPEMPQRFPWLPVGLFGLAGSLSLLAYFLS